MGIVIVSVIWIHLQKVPCHIRHYYWQVMALPSGTLILRCFQILLSNECPCLMHWAFWCDKVNTLMKNQCQILYSRSVLVISQLWDVLDSCWFWYNEALSSNKGENKHLPFIQPNFVYVKFMKTKFGYVEWPDRQTWMGLTFAEKYCYTGIKANEESWQESPTH